MPVPSPALLRVSPKYYRLSSVETAAGIYPTQDFPTLLNPVPSSGMREAGDFGRPVRTPVLQVTGDTSAASPSETSAKYILVVVLLILAAAALVKYLPAKISDSSTSLQDADTTNKPNSLSPMSTIALTPSRDRRLLRNWQAKNSRRIDLIRKQLEVGLSRSEETELARLDRLATEVVDAIDPLPYGPLEEMERLLGLSDQSEVTSD
jgi:hypothetical protein